MAAPSFHISFPPTLALSKLDGTNWQTWGATFTSLMLMNGVRRHLSHSNPAHVPHHPTPAAGAVGAPTGPTDEGLAIIAMWEKQEEVITGLLYLSVTAEVLSGIVSDALFPSVHDKFSHLDHLYGQVGSMATFNLWVGLANTKLQEGTPFQPQLQKMLDSRNTLVEQGMPVSDM